LPRSPSMVTQTAVQRIVPPMATLGRGTYPPTISGEVMGLTLRAFRKRELIAKGSYLWKHANVAELADAQDLGFSLLLIRTRPPIASNDIELIG
jgi:hypothetical protein